MSLPRLMFHTKVQDDVADGEMHSLVVCHLHTANRSTRLFGLFQWPLTRGYALEFGGRYANQALKEAGRDVFEHFFGNGTI